MVLFEILLKYMRLYVILSNSDKTYEMCIVTTNDKTAYYV